MKRSGWLSTLSAVALSAAVGSASYGQVTGTVKLEGKAPARPPITAIGQNPDCAKLHKEPVLDETVVADKDGNLANVSVFIKGAPKAPAPKDPVVIDQKGCVYAPHVVSVTVGQPLHASNSDGFLHNVHTLPELNEPTNMAQPAKTDENGQPLKPLKAAEFFKVKCDVHPWMSAYVGVFDHPFHSVTLEDGSFEIPTAGLKDGDYEIAAWHEKYKELKGQKITVKGGKAEANLKFKAAAAAAEPKADDKAVVLTSAAKCDGCCEKADKTKAVAAKAGEKSVVVK